MAFYYIEICSPISIFTTVLSWIDVEFCQVLSLYLWRWSYSFSHFICWYCVSHWLFAYVDQTLWCWNESNLVVVLCIVGFGFLIICWEFSCLWSSKILACNFLFWHSVWQFWYQGDDTIECLWECSKGTELFIKQKLYTTEMIYI